MTRELPPPTPLELSPARGLVVDGVVLPGTDWVRRDPAYWWTSGRGTRPRAQTVDLLVGHWTAGEAGTKSFEDDGPRVVHVMRERISPRTGKPMNVGIHFVIGACEPDAEWAPVWQTADPGRVATVHVGMGSVNRRAIGVEVVSAGLPGPADVRSRPVTRQPVLGRMRDVLRFYPGQLRTWVALSEELAALDGYGGVRIPRRVPPQLAAHRFTKESMKRYSGALEHLHVPNTRKVDAGGLLVEALVDAGWTR